MNGPTLILGEKSNRHRWQIPSADEMEVLYLSLFLFFLLLCLSSSSVNATTSRTILIYALFRD